ncbi:MAG TPA: Hsp20/alpha crystallin family protein [Chthoniobacterales bacterium]|jgi:HSP20 family molecular chaperone IbpA
MKIRQHRKVIVFAAALAFAAVQFLNAAEPASTPSDTQGRPANPVGSPQARATEKSSSSAGVDKRMQRLDNRLNSVFTNTFRDLDDWFGRSDLASSIDLREQKDKYVVRVYVPDTSKVNASVENNALHVTAEDEQQTNGAGNAERYEQILSPPGPVQRDKMKIDRKENLVVIDLPKTSASVAAATPKIHPGVTPPSNDLALLDQSIINRMARMQGRIEQTVRDAFPYDLTSGSNTLQLGSAVNIDEQNNNYIARFYLSDKDLKNVNAELENGNLRLTASETSSSQQAEMNRTQSGRYEQLVTLPGPVKEKGMKVERNNGTIVVTLPKA